MPTNVHIFLSASRELHHGLIRIFGDNDGLADLLSGASSTSANTRTLHSPIDRRRGVEKFFHISYRHN